MKIDLPADLLEKANRNTKAYEKALAAGDTVAARRIAHEIAVLYNMLAWKVPLREQNYRDLERAWKTKADAIAGPDFIADEVPLRDEPQTAPGSQTSKRPRHVVFISYSKPDMQVAHDLCAYLEQQGIGCWIAPRDVLPGENFPGSIIDAIDASRIVLLVFSKSSDRSPHVIRELTRAVNQDLHIIPFRLEDILPSKNMTYLINIPHWFDAFPPPATQYFPRLAVSIRSHLAGAPAGDNGPQEPGG